jgi:hypothetical protein
MKTPIIPTKIPDPTNVGMNGALTFYNQAAIPADEPIVTQF